ncbi:MULTISPECIES: ureidoglycolate lyase [Aphanothece]|uniref:ureidoglycolate lyase n=1 Tax=Aphanothece TaxID=1121 RepID=UPI00398F1C67
MEASAGRPQGLIASTLTPAAFAPFGFVIQPQPDDAPWCPGDAVLQFGGGPPRLYLMTLPPRGLGFAELARHRRVSQALGAIDDQAWFLVVARPDHPAGRPFAPAADLHAFSIPPRRLVVLHPGTWHAGPLFAGPAERVFLNLESRTTNRDDRTVLAIGGRQRCVVDGDQEAPGGH